MKRCTREVGCGAACCGIKELLVGPALGYECAKFRGQLVGVSAGEKIPLAETAPVIDRGDPAAGGLVLGVGVVETSAFYLNDDGYSVREPDEEVRFVNVGVIVQFIRDIELQAVVADVTVNDTFFRQLLKLEYGG